MNKEQKQFLLSSLFSGIMIGIGCTVYLSCVNKLVGALLFCAGLFFILTNGGTLFTGICGLKTPVKKLTWVFVLNGLGTVIPAIVSWSNVVDGATRLGATAAAVMLGKLGMNPVSWLLNGLMCGVLMYLAAGLTCLLVLFLIGYVLYKGVPNLSWELVSTSPSYLSGTIGILPDLLNTLYVVMATLLIVLPLGVCAAIYLTEYAANKRLVGIIEYAAETLSGIPSIIYGLVGMLFFCQFLGMKTSLWAGSMTLVIMNLPTIMRTTQESLKTVPQSYREGAFGLGAGKWRVIRTVVMPGCVDGVITGCILAVGRILGETAALLYTAGFAHTLYGLAKGLQNSGATLTVALYVYAKEQGEFDVAFAIASILMVLTLLINLSATLVGRYFKKRRSL